MRRMVDGRHLSLVALVLGLRMMGCAAGSEKASEHDDSDSGIPSESLVTDGSSPESASGDDGGSSSERCSEDGWCRVDMPNDKVALFGIWGSSATDVWAVGSNGAVFHWNGTGWTSQRVLNDAGQPKPIYGIWGSGPHDVWAFGVDEVLHSDGWNDTETVWSNIGVPGPSMFESGSPRAIWGSSSTDVWMLVGPLNSFAVGLLNKCWHSDGWAGAATELAPALDYYIAPYAGMNFNGMWGTGPNDVWIVGENGRILHTDGYWDKAAFWTQPNSNTRSHLTGIWGAASDDVWAVGENGTIRHWTYDAGGELDWIISDSKSTTNLRAVWGSSATDIWAVGDDNTILHGDGSSWTRSQVPTIPSSGPFYGVWGSGPNDVWVVGQRALLHRSGASGGVE